ncbi:MAG: homoserine dehydrogenase [Bifidobacteriaceae bacterium]|jgi:homoserine dehydrogenase|nr:homoserine dehydrogenase [Bifidobacteriaceae bacterium]
MDFKVGLIGYGTVGRGVVKILNELYPGSLAAVAKRNFTDTDRKLLDQQGVLAFTDWTEVVHHPEVQIVVEVIGNPPVAQLIIETALQRGLPVVTANKSLLATTAGLELIKTARQKAIPLRYEAAVGGGIPIVNSLGQDYLGDVITGIRGILNGTTNFILSSMTNAGLDYASALAQAQNLGFAEADPSDDVQGYDSANKLAILSRLAFGRDYIKDDVQVTGITDITPKMIASASIQGQVYKLIATSYCEDLRVQPELVPVNSVWGLVNGGNSLIEIETKFRQKLHYYGLGAGSEPTAAAVVNDIVLAAKEL